MKSFEKTLKDLLSPLESFYKFEEERADKSCFVQPYANAKVVEYSWRDVGLQVRVIAAYLKSLNLPEGSNIAVLSANCAYWIMADIAIWMAGHCSVPLYPNLTAASIRQILEHSGSRALFVGKVAGWENMHMGIPDGMQIISMPISPTQQIKNSVSWASILKNTAPLRENPVYAANKIGTIIYTSGTTGTPKGVMHSFQSLALVGKLGGDQYNLTAEERKLSYLPLAHAAERASVEMSQLFHGYTVFFNWSLETFAEDLKRASPTTFLAVPRIWQKLQQRILANITDTNLRAMLTDPDQAPAVRAKLLSSLGFEELRIATSGAAPLSKSLMVWFKLLGIEILEGYAMSENLAYSHTTPSGDARAGYVGVPNPYVECKLSAKGEILIKSPCNMIGYYREPELTAEVLDDEGFIHTGDLGRFDQTGRLKIIGRTKELFKTSKGKYVAPAVIENLLSQNMDIETVCVLGSALPKPIALVNLSDAARKKFSEHREAVTESLMKTLDAVNQNLNQYERISHIIVTKSVWSVENEMLTPTLKVKRMQLESMLSHKFEGWQSQSEQILFER